MLEDLFGSIPARGAVVGALMVTWAMAHSSMLSGCDEKEKGNLLLVHITI